MSPISNFYHNQHMKNPGFRVQLRHCLTLVEANQICIQEREPRLPQNIISFKSNYGCVGYTTAPILATSKPLQKHAFLKLCDT
jgi:hypothetical protein